MKRLSDIEAAAADLPAVEKQELMLFLAARLRGEGARVPEPREFTGDRIAAWVREDEAQMRQFRDSK